MSIDAELADQLAVLRQQFSSGLPRRLDAIRAALDACRADPADETALSALMTALHSLGGAAGIFGYAALGDQARDAEHWVMGWIDAGGGSAHDIEELAARVYRWAKQA